MTEDVKPDLGSNLSAEGKRAILVSALSSTWRSLVRACDLTNCQS